MPSLRSERPSSALAHARGAVGWNRSATSVPVDGGSRPSTTCLAYRLTPNTSAAGMSWRDATGVVTAPFTRRSDGWPSRAEFEGTGLGLLVTNAYDENAVERVVEPRPNRRQLPEPKQWLDRLALEAARSQWTPERCPKQREVPAIQDKQRDFGSFMPRGTTGQGRKYLDRVLPLATRVARALSHFPEAEEARPPPPSWVRRRSAVSPNRHQLFNDTRSRISASARRERC